MVWRIKEGQIKAKKVRSFFSKKKLALAGVLTAGLLIVIPVMTYARYANDISDKERLMNRNNTGVILRDKNGEIFYEYGKLGGVNDVKLSEISDAFEKAVIASEDENFYNHPGYSVTGIASATYANVLNKDPTLYGGSTITQQLVKNKLLTSNKSFLRKYQEIAMAIAVEKRYSKDEILEMYLNSVYFGEGAFGVSEASKTYFNKKPQDLNLTESALLTGLLPAPASYSPITGDAEKAKMQQERVLSRMIETGDIAGSEREQAIATPLVFNKATVEKQANAQHFAMMVLDKLKEKYGEETIIRSGFDVTTTLDMAWQKEAEAKVKEKVQQFSKAGARNGSLVAIDPKTGEIRALVGSANWEDPAYGKFNVAINPRQPGSSFKPIYYTEAINKKAITAATVLDDAPKDFGNYKPENYDFKYRGKIPARNALAQSLNIPAVEVMQKIGVNESAQIAQRMGIADVDEPDKYGLSLALGTAEVKLYDMVNAYAAFANTGMQYEPKLLVSIKDKYKKGVSIKRNNEAKRVQSAEASYIISNMLSDNEARAPTFGSSLNIPDRRVAVKTGTTNDSKDAWTIGYTPNVVVGVWMGNNENEPMVGLAGSSSAGRIWKDTISSYLKTLPKEDFVKPAGVVVGKSCDGGREEVFIMGTEGKNCNQAKPREEKKEEKKPEEEKPQEEAKPEEEPTPEKPKPPKPTDTPVIDDEAEPGRGGDPGTGSEPGAETGGTGETGTTAVAT